MNAAQFVENWNDLKQEMLEAFWSRRDYRGRRSSRGYGHVCGTAHQLRAVLDGVMRDTMYTLLLGLEGAASIGRDQQGFTILDDGSNVVGPIDEEAWKCFQGTATS